MNIRKAEEKDIPGILRLLGQVLEIHATIRPDIFISGTTKYTPEELFEILQDPSKIIYVSCDEKDEILGYAFCILKQQPASSNMVQFQSLYIDDLCVDSNIRGQNIGRSLFEFVKEEAQNLGCYEVTLNVWEGNDNAKRFYEKMGLKPMKTVMEYIL